MALVGASRSSRKFGNTLLRELRKKGYTLKVIHPEADTIEGEPCLRSLNDVAGMVESVLIVTSPKAVPELMQQAAAAGIKRIWLQQGAESSDALRVGEDLGLNVVHGQCILMHADPSGPHAVHRFFVKLFRRLPA
jgi:predicted CoA-binding protein